MNNKLWISKEDFVKVIGFIKEHDKKSSELSNALTWFSEDAGWCFFGSHHINKIIELLEKLCDDTGEWISYFLYELDFGKNYPNLCAFDENDEPIPMSTAEELYDFLESEHMKKLAENG